MRAAAVTACSSDGGRTVSDRRPLVPLDKVVALEPACLRVTIPESYRDENGHMNMRWYVSLFDDAGEALYVRLGITPEFHRQHGTGTFDLEHHTHFLSEVSPGDCVAVYVRLVGHSAKRFHYLMFMVNETRGRLAAIFECVNALVDLAVRKMKEFPGEMASNIEAAVAADAALDWRPPVCGVMHA
jgi:acyl-CoA thioester hydrolase